MKKLNKNKNTIKGNFIIAFFKKSDIMCVSMLVGASIAILMSGFASFARECETMPDEVLRLHIIANSDNDADQSFKYALRDWLLSDFDEIFNGVESLDEACLLAQENIGLIEQHANEYAAQNGYTYEINAELTEMYFTTRVYENLTMPAGNYQALRLTIGSGQGQNWWCVMFPPLCLPAAGKTNDAYPAYFSKEASKAVENNKKGVEIRFAIFEWLESVFK